MRLITNTQFKQFTVEIISLLYILLFVYASVSKLLDFDNFQIQLGQSPLISAFASWVSWLIPIIELVIVLLLINPKFRNFGFLAAFTIMAMFTVYIFIVLHYSSFVPCSCGGILEKMSWNIHLVFNVIFMLLAAIAMLIQRKLSSNIIDNQVYAKPIKKMVISFLFSTLIMTLLFLYSEQLMHYENPFIRRYPGHSAILVQQKDLKFNSYYFSGLTNRRVYLGNYTSPLQLLSFDQKLKKQQLIKISFEYKNIPFQMISLSIKGSNFYLKDGRVPILFRGDTANWKITKELQGLPYFTHAEIIDSTTIVFRSNKGKNLANILGIFSIDKKQKVIYNESLLTKQIDGVFDTDGILMYDQQINKVIYLYFYRNEFIISDKSGKFEYKGNTIDTTTKAKIKVTYLKDRNERTMSAPPLVVNANAAAFDNLLFVHSKIKGRFEKDKLWEQAAIIDVYDVEKKIYLLSFPLYNIGNQKLNSFVVDATNIYAIIGNQLVIYELKDIIKKEMKTVSMKDN